MEARRQQRGREKKRKKKKKQKRVRTSVVVTDSTWYLLGFFFVSFWFLLGVHVYERRAPKVVHAARMSDGKHTQSHVITKSC